MSSVFSEQILGDKLSKLNNTQQCIETLSHWCIFHRKDAEKIVQTWDKQFHDSDKERKIPFLYLANDILQNSKKNGKEFVEEFWKILPAALREMTQNGDERAKTVVSRLVDIWEERRVFGSRPKGLKDLMLGNEPLPKLELNNNKKRARSSVKIVRRDSRSIRIKLSIGGTAEKIISAFNAVLDEESEEDSDLERCKSAVKKITNLEKDVENASNQVGDSGRETLSTALKAEENSLKKCIEKLKSIESNRANLVSQLREALKEQEPELEKVRTQVQVAEAAKEQVANLQRRLKNEPIMEPKIKKKKSSAAEVADRLAASAQSTQIMSSVLSSFAQQEKNNNNNNNNSNDNNNNNNNTNNNNNSNISSSGSGSNNTGVYMIGMPYGYGTAAQPPVVVVPPPAPAAAAPASLGFVRPIMPPQQQNIGLVPINGQMINVNQQFGPPPPGFRMPFYPPPS